MNAAQSADPQVLKDLKKYEDRLAGLIRPELIRKVEFPRPSAKAISAFSQVTDLSSMVADVLDGFGLDTAIPATVIPPLAPGQRMVGAAVTARHAPARHTVGYNIASGISPSLGGADKVMLAQPGDVLVIDARSVPGVSNFGGIVAVAASAQRLSGVVVDGSVRDVEKMRELKLAVWAKGATPRTGKYRAELVEMNGVVEIGGVQVRPGDLMLGDSDGIVVVPLEIVDEVAARAVAIAEKEAKLITALAAGASAKEGAEILPPSKW